MITKNTLRIFILIFILQACHKNEKEETGTVSFGTNTDLANCLVTPKIYIDNIYKGILPGYIDSIRNCSSDSTFNIELTTGYHTYKFVAADDSGNCRKEILGDFFLNKDECMKIFINSGQ
jgi:hypothetical protein